MAGLVFSTRAHSVARTEANQDRAVYALAGGIVLLALILLDFLVAVLANGSWGGEPVRQRTWLTWYAIACAIGLAVGLL